MEKFIIAYLIYTIVIAIFSTIYSIVVEKSYLEIWKYLVFIFTAPFAISILLIKKHIEWLFDIKK